ncbi:MAG: carboxypeptidase-like regulatory domain-containing protein [Lentimicrobiaceae bacterium]|jgi:hypothetical protein
MKQIIFKHQKYKAIGRVLNNYPLAFAEKTKALAMLALFIQYCDDLSELISKLLRPLSTIHRPKQESQQKFTEALSEFIGMGILLATDLKLEALLDILKVYKGMLLKSSAYRRYEIAVHVVQEIEAHAETAAGYGITAEKLTAFSAMVESFGETLENTSGSLTVRRSGRKELERLMLACSKMIRMQIDPFIIFNEKEFPELYREYFLVRGQRKKYKRTVKEETLMELSGTVTDKALGTPIAGAVLTLAAQDLLMVTDADGYFVFEELPAGTYTLSCQAEGYKLPENATVTLAGAVDIVCDFELEADAKTDSGQAA